MRKIYRRLIKFSGLHDTYIVENDSNKPWIFISYIADPFYNISDQRYLNGHQNKREALVIADVFINMGYNIYIMNWNSQKKLPDINVKLVFGHEPNFVRACEKYKDAKKIYYGVSAYYEYRNNMIKTMTDKFNLVFNAKVPYRRLVIPNDSVAIADKILLIGSKYTINTFPCKYRNKITLIHQSTQPSRCLNYVKARKNSEFFYIASKGNAFKGVGILIEYFICHSEVILHWVGPIEKEVYKAIRGRLTPNIHTYGFQDIGNDLVLHLMDNCDFIIYPSAVEGVPGAVLNAMKNGLIPLVTPWASFEGIENIGFIMDDASVSSVEEAVNWALSLSTEDIELRKKECQRCINKMFNLERFRMEFE